MKDRRAVSFSSKHFLERRQTMKKLTIGLLFGLALLLVFGANAIAQILKEGTVSTLTFSHATLKFISMGQERVHVTYESFGLSLNDSGEGLFHNASMRCIGANHAVNGAFEDESGFCVYTHPDGDQIFVTYKAAGKTGIGSKGTATIVGGTGKLTGIQGSLQFTRVPARPAVEGTSQVYLRSKGQYKLP
jgi:hypothetical protein